MPSNHQFDLVGDSNMDQEEHDLRKRAEEAMRNLRKLKMELEYQLLQRRQIVAMNARRALSLCSYLIISDGHLSRVRPIPRQRFEWHDFVADHKGTKDWTKHLRMHQCSFDKLLSYIRHKLIVNEVQAARRGGMIIPELQLYCTIRYLSGASYSDLYYFCGISRSALHNAMWRVIIAINFCPQLQVRFPSTEEECATASAEFKSVSTGHAINNCVCVLDGYHLQIIVPSKKVARNVRSYFNGHYRCYGVNVQAACNRYCQFVFFGVAAPGVTPDRDAITKVELASLVEGLQQFGSAVLDDPCEDNVPKGYYCAIGDCAYTPSNNLAPIFGGAQAKPEENDNYNYFASQLRIRIEMAFGMMVEKWAILQSPLRIHLDHVKYLALCIAQLHNFCISERLRRESMGIGPDEAVEYVHDADMQRRDVHATIQCEQIAHQEYIQSCKCRDYLVQRVKSKGLVRPGRN